MANMHLVTGYAGTEHIRAADDGALNAAILGGQQFVLGKGNRLSASAISSNTIRVLDGDIIMQGRFIRLNENSYVDLTIESGAQGYKRNDLIVARYTKNAETMVEEVNLVVIKGTATQGTPSDPVYTEGDILNNGVALNDMPLYRVPVNGVNLGTPVKLFATMTATLADLEEMKGGGSGEGEWQNPPMVPGVEYRTTERWNGHAVYCKLLDCGAMADGKSIDINGLGAEKVIRYHAMRDSYPLPVITSKSLSDSWSAWVDVYRKEIVIYCGAEHVGYTCYVTLHYIRAE